MVKVIVALLIIAWAKVAVYGPASLRDEITKAYGTSEIPSSLANFGNPPYGSIINGRLFRTKEDERLGCGPIAPMDFTFGDPDLIITPILLLDRGNCSFVQKVRHAQDIGVSAVLIADNVDYEKPWNVLMSDDGTGGNLNIPSFLITKNDSDTIRKHFSEEFVRGIVSMTLSFEMQREADMVQYEIWMSSDLPLVRSFLYDFYPYAKALEDSTKFTPHYVLWYCSECKKEKYTYDNSDCVSRGQYCAPDPDGNGPLTGKHVVLEDLRQICVFKEEPKKWWDYVFALNKTCPTNKFDSDCSSTVLTSVKIDPAAITKCMNSSFEQSGNYSTNNDLLNKERKSLINAGIFFFPAIIINNQTMRGDIEAEEVLQGVCAGYQNRPDICKNKDKPLNDPASVEGISMGTLLFIVCAAVVLLVGVLVIYRMWLKREINTELKKQINMAVGQYFALADTSREESS